MKKLIALFLSVFCTTANAAPSAELWPRWQTHDAASETVVAHDAWNEFLSRYLAEENGVALVAYGAVSAADKNALNDYLTLLSQTPVSSLNQNEQLAFWINLYNALTINTVLDHYPVSSIKKISGSLFSPGPWDDKLTEVEGEALSLNDIEHRILRPIWQDPRIHYAVNCASVGCPNLAATAYTGATAETMLAAAATAFINHPRGANVANGELRVSSIYAWFSEDFGDADAAIIAHLTQYAEPSLREKLQTIDRISGDEYDWSLNDKK